MIPSLPSRRRVFALPRLPLLAVLSLAPTLLAAACSSPPEPAPSDATTAQSYEVRGEVKQVPTPEDPASEFVVRHEAIDNFVAWDGEVAGMGSMTMPFPVTDDGLLQGIEVGDKVRLVLEVDWESDSPLRVVEVEEIPATTELEFRAARPPAGD